MPKNKKKKEKPKNKKTGPTQSNSNSLITPAQQNIGPSIQITDNNQLIENNSLTRPGHLKSVTASRYQNLGSYNSEAFTWNKIPMFAVIAGKNGVGKSTVLNAILFGYHNTQQNVTLNFEPKSVPQICSLQNTSSLETLRRDTEDDSKKKLISEQDTLFEALKKYALAKAFNQTINILPVQQQIFDEIIQAAYAAMTDNVSFTNFDQHLKIQFDKRKEWHIADYNSIEAVTKQTFNGRLEAELSQGQNKKMAVKNVFDYINAYLDQCRFKFRLDESSFAWNINNGQFERIALKIPNKSMIPVSSGNMSSGERMELLVLFWQLNQRNSSSNAIILLDEPDAHLHPSLVKEIITIIKLKLVKELGLQVIMTTHNPTTVSFVPEECLFVLENEAPAFEPKIVPVKNKQRAINILSGNLVYVNEPFAVTFVEGQKDQAFYGQVIKRLNDSHQLDSQIIFKVHGSGEKHQLSSCSAVETLVTKMTSKDETMPAEGIQGPAPLSQFIFGLVDGDNKKHIGPDNLKHLKRYSVENYLLDPLNLFISFKYIEDANNTFTGALMPCIDRFKSLFQATDLWNKPVQEFTPQEIQTVINIISGHLMAKLKDTLKNREDNYRIIMDVIGLHLASLKEKNASSSIFQLAANIHHKPSEKNNYLKTYFKNLLNEISNLIEETNEDLFNANRFLSYRKKITTYPGLKDLVQANTQEVVLKCLEDYFTDLLKIVNEKISEDWKDFINAHGERAIKIMDADGQLDFTSVEREKVTYFIKGQYFGPFELEYPRLLHYFRGHDLQTAYEKLFKLPHKLADDFSYIMDSLEALIVPEELIDIFKSMKPVIESQPVSSTNDKIYANSGMVPFFKKIQEKTEKTKKREEGKAKHEQALEKQKAKEGIDEEMFGESMNIFNR